MNIKPSEKIKPNNFRKGIIRFIHIFAINTTIYFEGISLLLPKYKEVIWIIITVKP